MADDLPDSVSLSDRIGYSPAWGTTGDTHVELSSKAENQLAKMPGCIAKRFSLRVDFVSMGGLAAARAIPVYRDHILKGEWKRRRAIRMSNA